MTSRVLAGLCSLIGFTAVVGYLIIIQHQDGEIASVSIVWAAVMSLPAALALFGAAASSVRWRRFALVFAGVVYGMLGVLAIFSIGTVFLVASLSALLSSALLRPKLPAAPVV
jgi:hypothetical protein